MKKIHLEEEKLVIKSGLNIDEIPYYSITKVHRRRDYNPNIGAGFYSYFIDAKFSNQARIIKGDSKG